ncbi:MAG: exodeoxyribonuclease VII large subunit [Chakrabartia godavariana]
MPAEMPFDDAPEGKMGLLAGERAGDNAGALSVSEISNLLKRHVEQGFSHVRIRGEISGFKRAASGHLYLALKDENAVIDGVMWKGGAARLAFQAQDGVEVIATGKLTTYPGRSKYQIVIETMEIAGEGALLALLEKLKAKLAAEGLFSAERKRALPFLPRTIGVVTSPTGAVIRDILHRLADRCPTRVIVWPVLVQGQGSAEQVAAAVNGFSAMEGCDRPDLVIVARGGGSIEDLWGFNEEVVVRAVAACTIPIISAVGHETDTTLCDHAADVRAPTPTAAAEMAVPVRAELLAGLQTSGARALRCVQRYRERAAEKLDNATRRLPTPETLLGPQSQRVDEMGERLKRGLSHVVADARGELARATGALRPAMLTQRLDHARGRLDQLWRVATSLNPDRVLERGYARVERRAGGTVISAADAKAAGALVLRFADGAVDARVERAGSAPYVKDKPEQPDLF